MPELCHVGIKGDSNGRALRSAILQHREEIQQIDVFHVSPFSDPSLLMSAALESARGSKKENPVWIDNVAFGRFAIRQDRVKPREEDMEERPKFS